MNKNIIVVESDIDSILASTIYGSRLRRISKSEIQLINHSRPFVVVTVRKEQPLPERWSLSDLQIPNITQQEKSFGLAYQACLYQAESLVLLTQSPVDGEFKYFLLDLE